MAEGFKKHFNASTMSGRANVAKATYATMALLYIVYRIRRSGKKPGDDMLEDNCICDKEPPTGEHGSDTGFYETDPDCGTCRERSERAMSEYDREQQSRSAAKAGHDDECGPDKPPPPPPSSSPPGPAGPAGAEPPRRKCPCENPHQKVEGSLKSSSNNTRAYMQAPYKFPPSGQSPQDADDVHPVSEIVTQVHGAVYRVLSGAYNAVMGGEPSETKTPSPSPSTTPTHTSHAKDRHAIDPCICLETAADGTNPQDDDDEEATAARYGPMDCDCDQKTRKGPRCCDSLPEVDEGSDNPENAKFNDTYDESYASMF